MTFNRPITQTASDTGEEPFAIEEIFYSRTDKRGIIRAGNQVFRRVSGFEWDRLIDAPHRLVRHPDTPKAVFWQLWKTIQEGKPIAAYVKNRSQSGGWYWVMAVLVPYEDGYLSGRIKPSGALFAQAKMIYAEVAAAEQSQALAPDKSCELMLKRLEEAGFANYTDFMTSALEQDLAARDSSLGRSNVAQIRALASINSSLESTKTQQTAMLLEFDALQSIPTNMRIIASRLEPSGGPISAISDNYKFASTEISRRLEAFSGNESNLCNAMATIVGEALFLSGVARVLADILLQFATEDQSKSPVETARELPSLTALHAQYSVRAHSAMYHAEQVSMELNQACAEIRRMMLGLDTIRVMGRVESGRLGSSGVGLSSTIDQLDTRHAQIGDRLQKLIDLSSAIKSGINVFQRQTSTKK
ncbi:MAG: PAS domain-containing protein [Paracoccaceae bacterium]